MKAFTSAVFRIIGDDVNPMICSKILGIEPKCSWTKGDVYYYNHNGEKAIRYRDLWLYESKVATSPDEPELQAK